MTNNKKKRKVVIISFCAVIFLTCIIALCLSSYKSPYKYMKAHNGTTAQTKANEFLAQAHIDDKYIVFFVNENGNVACAIMKKKLLTYDVLRISGELSIRKDNENYLFSAYEDNGYEWIDWGLISESDIDKILVNGKEMNIIDNLQYSFRICWITGNGEENIPSNHEEKKVLFGKDSTFFIKLVRNIGYSANQRPLFIDITQIAWILLKRS